MKEPEESTFGDHLEVFRKHLIRAIIVISATTVLAFCYKSFVFDKIILAPKSPDFITNKLFCYLGNLFGYPEICAQKETFNLINLQISGQFMLHFEMSLTIGFILAFPYILWELWRFIEPALSKKEKAGAKGFIFYSTSLFTCGLLFGYYLITPLTLNFFSSYSVSDTLENQFTIQSYLSNLTSCCLSAAVAFELPIIIYFLSKIGIVTPKFLKKYRRHAIVILFIIAGILTPADPISIFLVAIPLLALYEISIIISKRVYKSINKI